MVDSTPEHFLPVTRANLFKLAAWYMQRGLKEPLEIMEEGMDPRPEAETTMMEGRPATEQDMGTA